MAGTRKYVRIPHKDLPDLFYLNGSPGKNVYFLRYRVSNEAGTSFSKWSQEFEVNSGINSSRFLVEGFDPETDSLEDENSYRATGAVTVIDRVLTVTWNVSELVSSTPKAIYENKFHVYVRTYTSGTANQWQFAQEVSATGFQTKLPSTVQNKADIAILVPTYRGLDAEPSLGIESPLTLYPESVVWYRNWLP